MYHEFKKMTALPSCYQSSSTMLDGRGGSSPSLTTSSSTSSRFITDHEEAERLCIYTNMRAEINDSNWTNFKILLKTLRYFKSRMRNALWARWQFYLKPASAVESHWGSLSCLDWMQTTNGSIRFFKSHLVLNILASKIYWRSITALWTLTSVARL